jgi:hypothetical protein
LAGGDTVALGTEAADYEAKFSQSEARAVIASAEKFIEKATAILSNSE